MADEFADRTEKTNTFEFNDWEVNVIWQALVTAAEALDCPENNDSTSHSAANAKIIKFMNSLAERVHPTKIYKQS